MNFLPINLTRDLYYEELRNKTTHKYKLGSLVKVSVSDDEYNIKPKLYYVVRQSYDCDRTPLYAFSRLPYIIWIKEYRNIEHIQNCIVSGYNENSIIGLKEEIDPWINFYYVGQSFAESLENYKIKLSNFEKYSVSHDINDKKSLCALPDYNNPNIKEKIIFISNLNIRDQYVL